LDTKWLPSDLVMAAEFHGHLCPGLVIGYRAAKAAMERLGGGRSEDEELVAIVENDSCAVDAVQFLTGCTFGKGNLIFRDHGKQVFTFGVRGTNRAVRVSLRKDVTRRGTKELEALAAKIKNGKATSKDIERERELRMRRMLALPAEEMFDIKPCRIDMPGEAQIHPSIACEECGEPTMETRLRKVGGRMLCIPCASKAKRRKGDGK